MAYFKKVLLPECGVFLMDAAVTLSCCDVQKHLPDAGGRSKPTATDDVTGRDVQVATMYWLPLSVFS